MNASDQIDAIFADIEAKLNQGQKMPAKTDEEIWQEKEAEKMKQHRHRCVRAIGKSSGWPPKYLEAATVPPYGEKWLAAYETAKDYVQRNGIVVFYGKRGNGKTRMAAELSIMVGNSRYRTAMRFFLEVRASFRKNADRSEIEIIDELTECGLLVLDEIQERGETAFEDRLLTHVIDARYAAMKPTILIANLTKQELSASLGDSIVDRARENGKSIEFNWESYRAK